MAAIATLEIALTGVGTDGSLEENYGPKVFRFSYTVLKREKLSLANGANTITPPTGAKLLLLDLDTAVSLTAKGISADTGIPLTPSSAPLGIPGLIPLSSVSSFVITNGNSSTQSVTAIWLG